MYSSLLLVIPYFSLHSNILYSYKIGFVLLTPVSFINHLVNYDGVSNNKQMKHIDHLCILYLNAISLTRSIYTTIALLLCEHIGCKLNYFMFIVNVIYQLCISHHQIYILIGICLCILGFNFNSKKKWKYWKRILWHVGIVVYTHYAGLCVNYKNTCLKN